jgi:hypothetical protein
MKRWFSHLAIAAYLGIIGFGLLSHMVGFRQHHDPAMYFIVWDMYAGWSAYETRLHILGEGQSGAYYDLSTPPWGEFHPYGDTERRHYDNRGHFVSELAALTLRHTDHEPMRQIVLVEEAYSKKFNLPDALWSKRFVEPKSLHSYFHVRAVLSPDGRYLMRTLEWPALLANYGIMDNPRLMADISRGHTFVAVDPEVHSAPVILPMSYQDDVSSVGDDAR